ncbi:hypothetical protein NP233_g2487 [Leucocoprinus birnbaumii]|uniref:tetrahydrofolate synthase n=1 Tax=Leucocoprinus birnbaumii TaxID=56174 RepID=A0AAD5W4H5_9AGAR|nr:hypothetical protein NP233_g2487 [Leucocoprinus birnbaumii]
MSTRTYRDAIDHLNSLQSNAATLEAVRASGGRLSEFAIPEMLEYLERIGYSPNDLNALNVIHITGTKGKGSTSSFVNSILQQTKPSWKVGLYTSPHLVAVRERIRINGVPISEDDFTKYFFEVWDKLVENDKRKLPFTSLMPGYFRFMTLLAFHTFLKTKVEATVLEVGVGGAYDSTNIVPQPVVTGITALGIDHVSVLGKTLKEIAWQKSGIFKASSPVSLRLAGKHQIQNATIAVELARRFLQERHALPDASDLPQSFIDGLKATRWPGRCQTVADPLKDKLTWYLDGAHTVESLDCCMDWFLSPGIGVAAVGSSSPAKRVIVFNCTSGRSGQTFLGTIYDKIKAWANKSGGQPDTFFDHVIFCTNVTYADGHFKGGELKLMFLLNPQKKLNINLPDLTTKALSDEELLQLTTQNQLATAWSSIVPAFSKENIHVLPSIEHAVQQINLINDGSSPVKVLVAALAMSSPRTYRDAVDKLNSLQFDATRPASTPGRKDLLSDMVEYLGLMGYSPDNLNALNIIHITGTKGKGSTSAFVNSILRHTQPSWKVGLFTSPHLSTVRERIRINGVPVTEDVFTRYFFDVWDKLTEHDKGVSISESLKLPGYFRYITLLGFHIFLKEQVNATVLEVGVGGAFDATNVVPRPVVTGVTALGIDHVPQLGTTIRDIAWHKGGIFKKGVPALTIAQPQDGMEVLEARARELQPATGLAGKHQVQNAILAVELARQFLRERHILADESELPQSFVAGLEAARWPGRCQTVVDPVHKNLTWYLDGAHTLESLGFCMDWFLSPGVGIEAEASPVPSKRILVFNCTRGRPGATFIRVIYDKIATWADENDRETSMFFSHVIFCTNATYANGHFKHEFTSKVMSSEEFTTLTIQNELAIAWTSIIPEYAQNCIHVLPSIEDAVNRIKDIYSDNGDYTLKVLVTGSLHLVAGVVEDASLAQVIL